MKVLLSFASYKSQSDVNQTIIVKHIIIVYNVADYFNIIIFNNINYNEILHSALTEVLTADDIILKFLNNIYFLHDICSIAVSS